LFLKPRVAHHGLGLVVVLVVYGAASFLGHGSMIRLSNVTCQNAVRGVTFGNI
jgi:hypothetical protein